MHVLFVHRSFPARFGHLAQRLVDRHGCRVTFVSAVGGKSTGGVRRIGYRPVGGDDVITDLPPISEHFVDANRHAVGVLQALRRAATQDASVRPDLVVGPGGLGATHLLPELWPEVPIVSLYDWFYTPSNRPEALGDDTLPERLRARARNGTALLDLEAMAAGWAPTRHQRELFGKRHARRLAVVPEAVDTSTWHRVDVTDRRLGQLDLANRKLVTFVARAGEPGRGQAAFLPVARRLVEAREDVEVLIIAPRAPHKPMSPSEAGGSLPPAMQGNGGNGNGNGGGTSKPKFIASQPRIHVNAPLPPARLRRILSLSDMHVHIGAPHAVAWSLLDAMACGAPIVATGTSPVRELLSDGQNAAITRIDTEAVTTRALDMLERPEDARRLGDAGRELVEREHSLDVVMPMLLELWAGAMGVDRDAFEAPPA